MLNSVGSQKLPSLDGWRAISILLVLVSHSTITAGFPLKPETALFYWCAALGNWGVRFFFVISGFLITHLMLQEHAKTGHISLKRFYLRRALRILPVCSIYLTVLCACTHYSQPASLWLANFTFTTNFVKIDQPSPTDHLWSLGVEEQFYVLWPCLLFFILHRPKGASKLAKILILPLLIAPMVRVLYHRTLYPDVLQFLFLDSSFFSQFDSLAYGCLAAFSFNFLRNPLEKFCGKRVLPALLAVLFIFAPMFIPFIHNLPRRLEVAGFDSMQAIGFSLLILQSILRSDFCFYRSLNWKWVREIGVLSYSIYIWQQMFCTGYMVFGVKNAWWVAFPAWILLTLVMASASYYFLEKPLLNLRAKLRG